MLSQDPGRQRNRPALRAMQPQPQAFPARTAWPAFQATPGGTRSHAKDAVGHDRAHARRPRASAPGPAASGPGSPSLLGDIERRSTSGAMAFFWRNTARSRCSPSSSPWLCRAMARTAWPRAANRISSIAPAGLDKTAAVTGLCRGNRLVKRRHIHGQGLRSPCRRPVLGEGGQAFEVFGLHEKTGLGGDAGSRLGFIAFLRIQRCSR